jgi:hypothetical protein
MRNSTNVKTREYVKTTLDTNTGELINLVSNAHFTLEREPDYIKLYISTVLAIKELSKSLNPILIEFIKRMSFATPENAHGGQVIYISSGMKKDIARDLDLSMKRLDQSLATFVKSGIFKRLDTGKYQVNPYLFGRGNWADVKRIREAHINFETMEITPIIEYKEVAV